MSNPQTALECTAAVRTAYCRDNATDKVAAAIIEAHVQQRVKGLVEALELVKRGFDKHQLPDQIILLPYSEGDSARPQELLSQIVTEALALAQFKGEK